MLYTGDMVSHRYNEQWQRGKIHSFPADEPNYALVLWANGDLEKVLTEDLELLGWNLYGRGEQE